MLFVIIIIIFFAMVAIGITKSIRSLGRKDYLKMEPVPGDPIELYTDSTSSVNALRDCAKAFEDFGKAVGGMRLLQMEPEEDNVIHPVSTTYDYRYDESILPIVESDTLMSAEKNGKESEPTVETKKPSVRRIRM